MTLNQPEIIAKPLFSGRKILWVGCAFILAVMCVSTADIIYSLRKTAVRSDAVISAFRQRSHLLDSLRGLMLRSALSPEGDSERGMGPRNPESWENEPQPGKSDQP